jgi:tetratricopeptide (TPR) repeat protein
MALSMMLPSFATVFASSQSSSESSDTSSSTADEGSGSSGSSSSDAESVDGVFSQYADEISDLETKLSDDPNNLAYLYNVGKAYMDCASSASQYASGDTDTEKLNEAYQTAMNYFDRYLALKDSDAVKVDRALCQLYSGDTSGSVSAFEQITANSPDYGPGWANLGLAYEASGDTTAAINAYTKAKETDPNDEYGAYSFAEKRLSYIQSESSSSSSSSSTSTDSSSTSSSSSTSGVQGLSNALSGDTTSSSQ